MTGKGSKQRAWHSPHVDTHVRISPSSSRSSERSRAWKGSETKREWNGSERDRAWKGSETNREWNGSERDRAWKGSETN
eukprot:354056-Chlamydomonas_euryale.AAC.1